MAPSVARTHGLLASPAAAPRGHCCWRDQAKSFSVRAVRGDSVSTTCVLAVRVVRTIYGEMLAGTAFPIHMRTKVEKRFLNGVEQTMKVGTPLPP